MKNVTTNKKSLFYNGFYNSVSICIINKIFIKGFGRYQQSL